MVLIKTKECTSLRPGDAAAATPSVRLAACPVLTSPQCPFRLTCRLGNRKLGFKVTGRSRRRPTRGGGEAECIVGGGKRDKRKRKVGIDKERGFF